MIDNVSHVFVSRCFLLNAFALSVLTLCSPFLLSRFTDCCVSRLKTEADAGIVTFRIICREFIYFHILT